MAQLILMLIAGYAAAGALFALAFVVVGAARLDHAAKGAPWSFRVLICPGAAALWPFLLRKWLSTARRARP